MATYNLTSAQLTAVLSEGAPEYQDQIVDALFAEGLYPITPGSTITAELVDNSNPGGGNFYDLSGGQQLFIEFGPGGNESAYMIDYVVTPQDAVVALAGASYTTLIIGGVSSNSIIAGDGNNLTIVANGNDVVYGGSGEFQILQGWGEDTLIGGGQNSLVAYSGANTLYGGLSGTAEDTLLSVAGGGASTLMVTYEGNNLLLGMSGSDTLIGGAGGDQLLAGLSAGAHDTLIAGSGTNFLQVVDGNNGLYSAGGNDTQLGGLGDDTLYGGGQSWLLAGSGGSTLLGTGADTLISSTGDDYLSGGAEIYSGIGGNDTVVGSAGSELIYSGLGGNDTIYGGGGEDALIFYAYTSAEVTVTVNGDGSTLYSFGTGDEAKTALVYNVSNVYFKT